MGKGCGCQTGMFKYLKPPYARKFHVPCVMHDDDYDWGGNEETRRLADRNLYWRIMAIVAKDDNTPWGNTWFTLIALLYYVSVRIFGRFYFNYK